MSSKDSNLLTEMRELMRRLHYSIHTENAYCEWVAKYINFHKMQARETLFIEPETRRVGATDKNLINNLCVFIS